VSSDSTRMTDIFHTDVWLVVTHCCVKVTWLMICFLCCYRKEDAKQNADTEGNGTQSTFCDSSPEKKQKQNPKVSINKHVHKKVNSVFKHHTMKCIVTC
jgi:hypothetical protein